MESHDNLFYYVAMELVKSPLKWAITVLKF